MTTFLLIRHALTAVTDSTLLGRLPGVSLSDKGVRQADRLASFARQFSPDAMISSPRERALETATYVSRYCGISLTIDEAFEECDFGRWTGMTFAALAENKEWMDFNIRRSFARAPGGESLHDVQYRAVRRLDQLTGEFPSKTLAIVTHADVIRSILTYVAGVPLDLYLRFHIEPASVTVVTIGGSHPVISGVNLTAP